MNDFKGWFKAWWAWSTGPGWLRKVVGFGVPTLVALVIIGAIGGGSESQDETAGEPTQAVARNDDVAPSAVPSQPAVAATQPPAPTQPPLPTAVPTPAVFTFTNGTKLVPSEVPPGTYRTRTGSANCYWARLSGLGGTLGEIEANTNTTGPAIVTIAATDKGFQSRNCATWTEDLSAITSSPTAPFKDGTYIVGVDVAAGTWRADATSTCYWARLSGFSGDLNHIIANENAAGPVVTIGAGDKGFTSSRCGTWTKIQ